MRKILAVVVVVMCISLMGCEKIKNVPIITGAGTTAYMGHDGVVDIVGNNVDAFSPRELIQLREANAQIIKSKAKIDALVAKKGSPAELVMDLPSIIPLYQKAKMAYIVAHDIIMDNIDEFSRQEQMILYSYESTCSRLDKAISEALMDDTGNADTIRDILSFTLLVGKIILPLLIL